MGLVGYACCGGTIGERHEGSCPGSPRYPLGREREAAERHVREIRRQLDTAREQPRQ